MKLKIFYQEKDNTYYMVDPEDGRRFTGNTPDAAVAAWKQRGVHYELEDYTPEETVQAVLEFMKMGMTLGEIVNYMMLYGTSSYEPNTFGGVSNRDFVQAMQKACTSGLPEQYAVNNDKSLKEIKSDLFEIMGATDLVIPKSFNVLAHVPLTTQDNKAFWVLSDDTSQYILIGASKSIERGWHFFERRAADFNDLLRDFVPEDDCGIHTRFNLKLQLKKKAAVGTFRFKDV